MGGRQTSPGARREVHRGDSCFLLAMLGSAPQGSPTFPSSSPKALGALGWWELLAASWLTLGSLVAFGFAWVLWQGITGTPTLVRPVYTGSEGAAIAGILALGMISGISGPVLQVYVARLRRRLGAKGPERVLRLVLCILVAWGSVALAIAFS